MNLAGTTSSFPALPAVDLLAGSVPVILIDTREQDPLPIEFPSRREGMATGDYSYAGGDFAVERKSIPDLVACFTSDRKRFEAQLKRMCGYSFARLLIVGHEGDLLKGNYRSRLKPIAALHSLFAIEARYVPVAWSPNPESAARLVEQWAFWHYREALKTVRAFKEATKLTDAITSANQL